MRRHDSGLTILEILVAIVLMAAIFAVLAPVIRQARVAGSSTSARQGCQETALLALRRLTSDLVEARRIVYPARNRDGSPRTAPVLAYKSFSEETVLVYLNPTTGEVARATATWREDGSGFSGASKTVVASHPDFRELRFTVAGNSLGREHVRIVLETKRDTYLHAVRCWNGVQ